MADADLETPPIPRRRRRWLRWLALAIAASPVIAIIAVVTALATLPRWLTPERLRQEAIAAAEDALDADVAIESLDYDLAWGFVARGIRVGPPPGFTRDVARIEAIEVRWTLPWESDGEVVIERAAIVRPELVVETRGGVRNVDRLVSARGEEAVEEEVAEKRDGPLSPITVVLREVAIERAALELDGEGPQAIVDGLGARLEARIDPSRLDARLALTSSQARVDATLPDRRVRTKLDLDVEARVGAQTHAGIALERLGLDAKLGLVDLDPGGQPALPPITTRLDLRAALDGTRDRFDVDHVALSLDGREVARFGLAVDGVLAAVADASGDRTLGAVLGMAMQRPGTVTVRGPGITLALDPLMPLVRAVAPGVTVGGEVRLVLEPIEGRVSELMALRPRTAGVRLELDRLRVSGPAEIAALDGAVTVTARGTAPLAIDGAIRGRGVRSGASVIDTMALDLAGTVERPRYPQTGTASITAHLALAGVSAPGARVRALDATLAMSGVDPLDPQRLAEPPVRVSLATTIDGIRASTGTVARDVAQLRARIDATIDRLLAPARSPIAAKLELSLRGVRAPEATVDTLSMRFAARADDPRHGRPIAARLDGTAQVGGARANGAIVHQASWRLAARASGIDATGRQPLPASATVDTTLTAGEVELTGARPVKTSLALDADLDFVRAGEVVTVRKLRARAADTLDLTLSGRISRALQPDPIVDLRLSMAPLDLGKPVLARAASERFEGRGTIALEAQVKGQWTGAEALVERLDAPPIEGKIALRAAGVRVLLPDRNIAIEGLDGAISAELARGRTQTQAQLRLAHASSGAQRIEDLAAGWSIGLDEGVWRAKALIEAAELGDARTRVDSAVIDVDIAHPPFGDVDVRKLVIRAPGAGVEASLTGRLSRERFGAVRPDLALSATLDIDQLRAALADAPAALRPMTGKVGFDLATRSPTPSTVRIDGALTVDGFGWSQAGTKLVGATGRMPFSQLLVIGAPDDRALIAAAGARGPLAESWTGLAASLRDLEEALNRTSRIVLEPEDVLVVSPRTADYEALRPYYRAPSTARLTIERLEHLHYRLVDVSMDIAYRSGVVKLDRFATRLWDGDIYGELAFQIAGQDHLRLRLRSTITDLNLDVPVAAAMRREPSSSSEYLVSGNLDLRVDLRDRTLDGYFDFTKMGREALVGIIDAMDPERRDKGLQATRDSMDLVAKFGLFSVRLGGTVMSIRNNLLDMDFVWDYEPLELPWFFTGLIPVSRLILGPIVMNSVRSLIKDYSLSNYLEGPWVKSLNQAVFVDAMRGRLLVEDEAALAQKGAEP